VRAFFINKKDMNNPIYPFRGSLYYPIECALNNANAQSNNSFKDLAANTLLNPNRNNKVKIVVRAIETYIAEVISTAPSGRPLIPYSDANNIAVTFRVKEDEPIFQMPYITFITSLNYGIIKEVAPMSINFEKSEVINMANLTVNPGNTSAYFGIWYDVLTFSQFDALMKKMDEDKMKAIWR